jgi:DNA primase
VVALDGDAAGLAAAQRLIDLALPLLGPGRSLRFALMPPGQDPDDVVRGGGAAAIRPLLEASQPIVALLWMRETANQVLDSPERRAALDARLRAHLAKIADPGLRAHWQAEIRARRAALFAPRARRAEQDGRGARATSAGPRSPRPKQQPGAARSSPLAARVDAADARVREGVILYGCLSHPDLALAREETLGRLEFACADLEKIRDALLSALAESPDKPQAGDSLASAMRARLGFDPVATLLAIGQVRVSRHFDAETPADVAGRALDEEIERHAALAEIRAETREAELELTAENAWRLRAAAEAAHKAMRLVSAEEIDAPAEAAKSAFLQEQLDREVWKKPRRR